jgi:hypothetical protein
MKNDGSEEKDEKIRAAGGEINSFVPVDLSSKEESTHWIYQNASTAWIAPFREMTFDQGSLRSPTNSTSPSWPSRQHGEGEGF